MKGIASNQFSSPHSWIDDGFRGDDHPDLYNPHDHYVKEWTREMSTTPQNTADKLAHAAEVFLSYKTKSAGVAALSGAARRVAGRAGTSMVNAKPATAGLAGASVGAAGGALSADPQQGQSRVGRALVGAGLGAGAGLGGKRLLENRAWAKQLQKSKGQHAAATATQQNAALEAAKSGIKVPPSELAPEHMYRHGYFGKGDGGKLKSAAEALRRPPVADDSIIAASGSESSAMSKEASALSALKPHLPSALSWGVVGAGTGAISAPEGERLKAALRSGLVGGALGAYVPHMERAGDRMTAWAAKRKPVTALAKTAADKAVLDPEQMAVKKFPDNVTATDAIKEDVSGMWDVLREKAQKLKAKKVELGAGVKPTPVHTTKEAFDAKTILRAIKNPQFQMGALFGGVTAGANLLSSLPSKARGGKSRAEDKWEEIAKKTPEGEKGVVKGTTQAVAPVGHSIAQISRKHPVLSSLLAGAIGFRVGKKLPNPLAHKELF